MIKNLAIALLLLISAAFARAQDYPKRPINLVIPLAPGDATDTSARAVADELSRELNVPIVAVSASASPGDEHKAIEAGCTAFLSKPYYPAALREMLSHYLPAVLQP